MGNDNSDRLRLTIELAKAGLNTRVREFWEHPDLARIFSAYMLCLHASMRATVPLMQTAAVRARALAHGDTVAAGLAGYLDHHAKEELDHDRWFLEDMKEIGLTDQEIENQHPPGEIASMVGAQYYWIEFAHPVCVLGFFAVLEGDPPSTAGLDQLVARGIPKEALRTLYKHAVLDQGHRDDLFRLVDELPLSDSHAALMGTSAIFTVDALRRVLNRLLMHIKPERYPISA